jgi:hypothetical protein
MTSNGKKMAPKGRETANRMNTKQAQDEKATGGVTPGDGLLSRRHFARGGLTGSVLLSSLASKPVLGAASVGCTVSGQMSGNLSREALTFSCDVGMGRDEWLLAQSWPNPFLKGTLPDGTCAFNGTSTIQGTLFNGWTPGAGVVPPLIGAFFRTSAGTIPTCSVSLAGTNPATMLQVLNTTDIADPKFRLGRAVVCSLLNIANLGPDYPVTYHTVIAMFNATYSGGSYVVGGVTWSQARVIAYLESLFQPSM